MTKKEVALTHSIAVLKRSLISAQYSRGSYLVETSLTRKLDRDIERLTESIKELTEILEGLK